MDIAAGDREPVSAGRQALAAELRRLRDLEGRSGRDLASRIGISQSKVSRIESGSTVPSLPEVIAWGKELGVSVDVQEKLVSLTEAAYTEVHPWRAALQRRGHLQDDIQEQESTARAVHVFQPSVVPGLLQTAEYARKVCSLFQVPYSPDDLTAAVASRLHRQLALYEPERRFEFLITEAALRWRPGPPRLLLAQLDRIASVSTLENVSIGLIPHDVEAVTFTSHGFVVYDGDDEEQDATVSVETIHAKVTVNAPEGIELYRQRWLLLRQMAVFGDEARRFLGGLTTEITAAG
ncbi:helix-turn-helix transcriptional regulator [Amycolatopsis minnesotensis]|uniref:Helix-turn-helix transcriptional regulator n=1 Tax=Amycolatopsis minnesotensis TaxID=337894 RepID=A0ABP5CGF5_9PSEU